MSRMLFAAFALMLLSISQSSADIPQVINYQGKVTDTGGTPVSDGAYVMRFFIFATETGGSSLWDSGARLVMVQGGVFSIILGENPQPAIQLPFDQDYWMEIYIGGDVQSPRQQLGSVGYSYMASGMVPGTSVSGAVNLGTYAAIKASNTATSGERYGLLGISAANSGHGVSGAATAASGTTYGVYGESVSPDGRGVFGWAPSSNGVNYGAYGLSSSTAGFGVFGLAEATSGDTYGTCGTSVSTQGTGVLGKVTAPTGMTYGVVGEASSTLGKGVYGRASSTTGSTYGILGEVMSTSGTAVAGHASATSGATSGIYGEVYSTQGRGVYGIANSTTGVTYGLYGLNVSTDGRGVYGLAGATSGTTYGVYGYAESPDGKGVYGNAYASEGPTVGVYGETVSTEGTGVWGVNWATEGFVIGVAGMCQSTQGYGVNGLSLATSGVTYGGIFSCNSPSGYGVYYQGGLAGSGTKSCVVKTSQGPTLMYCQESPECWFEDFGEGQLIGGRCSVELDPLFLETVTIDAANPMHVFIELHGPCNGTYVQRGSTRFEVVEQAGGTSGVGFSYRIVAKRKDYESKRLDYCEAAETDGHLYPEIREKDLVRLQAH